MTFFPHLLAGPILHHKEMMPQFANLKRKFINNKNIFIGFSLLTIGLFKKVMIADYLSPFVQTVFDGSSTVCFIAAWLASFAYSFQLYFDFSGYCDMAVGIGFLFNIHLPINFNYPYKADSIQDFWRKWHVTLSRFLKNYIYIPLGGNRKGNLKTYRNLFLTFFIGGIWHGANWTFIFWGVLHGIAICIHRFWQNLNIKLNRYLSVLITFMFINFTLVFFRSQSLNKAFEIIKGMIGFNGISEISINKMRFYFYENNAELNIFLFIICIFLIFFAKNSNDIVKNLKPTTKTLVITVILFLVSVLSLNKITEFLYFQF